VEANIEILGMKRFVLQLIDRHPSESPQCVAILGNILDTTIAKALLADGPPHFETAVRRD